MVPVVDLFSGPGGLAEGFSACRRPDGRRRYRITLSIEKDRVAHRTLLLRAFLRKFAKGFPQEYYDFLNGVGPEEPDWAKLYPRRWAAACDETKCLELGTCDAEVFVRERIAEIRSEHGGRTVLLGGPPCQAYSVIGRSRNAGNARYNADEDDRQSLYEQYVHVLWQLRPAVAVMENVKGMLSAHRNGDLIFPEVIHRLRHTGGMDGYRLFALASRSGARSWHDGLNPEDFLVNAEAHVGLLKPRFSGRESTGLIDEVGAWSFCCVTTARALAVSLLLTELGLSSAIAVAFEKQDLGMVGQAVDQSDGARGVGEDGVPAFEG